ncbi:PREDICTED: purple acid phosphatase 23 isoform X2 [Tarenaya hassleriana]|uniref:purple acid phosphatase 23 isoform X2 n=1 Tax=Tarenaya hassleriana TaxID=28532 RepID=UPI00053C64B4|nr:PREDICTED: purple acid phosphatase 23 isoform X2 [Tarenaya hassleriana]
MISSPLCSQLSKVRNFVHSRGETRRPISIIVESRPSFVMPTLFLMILVTSIPVFCVAGDVIPTTSDGPFEPVTRRFDPSLRRGSDDLPMDHPRLRKRNTSSDFPEQISLALSSPTSMWVSWVTDAQIGKDVKPLNPSSVASEVWYGKEKGKYVHRRRGNATVYSQLYPLDLLNYTSGIIHHVLIDDLEPGTKYYYRCGDSSLPAMSDEISFETLPLPSRESYPRRIAFVGDLGLTGNTTTTIDHLMKNDPSLVVIVGDLSYANQYRTVGGKGVPCFSCSFPNAPVRETYQPRWDAWGRFMEPLTSRVPTMAIEGNHEIEPQASGIMFKSYSTRFAVPSSESGSNTNFYYSFDAGGVHFVMLGAYVDFNRTGAQYEWLKEDLARVDRTVTPWLVAAMHPPWYNSYSSHYQEFECMRQEMEELLYQYRVDIVFSGHVHAYERMNRVYNYTLNPCGPVYITIGDGGNIEKVDVDHADDAGKCPSPTDNVPEIGGSCPLIFSSGPAKGRFCWDTQPDWSAFRESSFGHGILEVVNSTHALWTWHRNQDSYKDESFGDRIYVARQPNLCISSASSMQKQKPEGRKREQSSGKLRLHPYDSLTLIWISSLFLEIFIYTFHI